MGTFWRFSLFTPIFFSFFYGTIPPQFERNIPKFSTTKKCFKISPCFCLQINAWTIQKLLLSSTRAHQLFSDGNYHNIRTPPLNARECQIRHFEFEPTQPRHSSLRRRPPFEFWKNPDLFFQSPFLIGRFCMSADRGQIPAAYPRRS